MNYLGHLYFSGNDTQLMCANLFGDFVKGNTLEFEPWIREGIQLHREIDQYIDHHYAVKEILPQLREQLPKVAPIAIDLYFDHLLAKYWNEHHPQEFLDYTAVIFRDLEKHRTHFPEKFVLFLGYFVERKWITYYPYFDGLERLSQGVSSKLNFENSLTKAPQVFLENESDITLAFKTFMEDARKKFLKEDLRILS